jgi:ribA/ribD-fused uncharacterized protein
MRTTDTHVFFWGGEFSNWFASYFKYKDHEFFNSEQAFMWEKAEFFGDSDIAEQILKTSNPKDAKALGRKVRGFDAERWIVDSYIFMVAVNYAKYSQNPRLRDKLLATDDKTLVEASPYDKIWGIGLSEDDDRCLDEHQWQGMNLLGKALIQVRKQLKQEENDREL